MATSGSFNTNSYQGTSTSRCLCFSWERTSYSVQDNTSTIHWELRGAGGNTTTWFQSGNFKVVIDGSLEYASSTRIQLKNGTLVASGNKTIHHNKDGTRAFLAYAEAGIYTIAVNVSGSQTWGLTAIPRASMPTLSATSCDMGSTIRINTNTASSSFTHRIRYVFAGAEGAQTDFLDYDSDKGYCHMINWTELTPPLSLASRIPNADNGTCTVYLQTYSDAACTNPVGDEQPVSFTLNVPSSVKPSCSFTVADATTCKETYGSYVQGNSMLQINVTGTGAQGSTIKQYIINADGQTYTTNPATSAPITSGDVAQVTVAVIDSRGRRSDPESTTLTVMPYTPPVITAQAYRCTSDGTKNDEGAYMCVRFQTALATLDGSNSATYEIRYKPSSESTWTTLTGTGGTDVETSPIACDVSQPWNVEVKVTDALKTTPAMPMTVPIAFSLVDYYFTGKGLAFGKVATRDGFDCDLKAWFNKVVEFASAVTAKSTVNCDGQVNFTSILNATGPASFTGPFSVAAMPDYVVEQGTSGIWTYRKWKSGIAECWGASDWVLLGYNAWGNGYETASAVADKIAYPSGLFNNVPHEIAEVHAQASGVYTESDKINTQTTTGTYYGVRPSTLDVDYYRAAFYVTGRWK